MMHLETTQAPASSQRDTVEEVLSASRQNASRSKARAAIRSIDGFLPAVAGVVLLALILRMITLADRSVWMDEAYSFWFSSLSWKDLWTQTPFYETHPPFYYSLLKLWMGLAGSSEAGMRSLSVFASLGTVALTAFGPRLLGLGKRYDRVGIVASLLLALNGGSIEYAQQARPYALQTLFVTLLGLSSVMLLRRFLDVQRTTSKIRGATLLCLMSGISGGIVLWLHNTSPFIIFCNWIAIFTAILLFSRYRREDLLLAVKALALALLIWSPCIPILMIESRTVAAAFWVTISPKMITWPYTLAAGGKFAFIPAVFLASIAWLSIWRSNKAIALYMATMLFVPVAIVFVLSYLYTPIFVTRTFEWLAPAFLFLVALGLYVPGKMERVRYPLLAVLLVLCTVQSVGYLRSATEDLRDAVRYLAAGYRPGDVVLFYSNEGEVGLHYYARQQPVQFDIAAIPARYPAVGLNRTYLGSNKGAPAAIESDRAEIDRVLATHKRVWFVGAWPGSDGKMNIVTDEVYRQRGAPISSVDFGGLQITHFDR